MAIEAVEREEDQGPFAPIKEVIRLRDETTGNTGRAFARILNIRHAIPDEIGLPFEDATRNVAMTMQVKDDLTDIAIDWGRNQNLVIGILQGLPTERREVEERIKQGQRVTKRWLRIHAPQTFQETYQLYQMYATRVNPSGDPKLIIMEDISAFMFHIGKHLPEMDRVKLWTQIRSGKRGNE
ncbi:MAG: hypothetical protein ABH950_02885 [Candidatus Altiarchaeota archaeon]